METQKTLKNGEWIAERKSRPDTEVYSIHRVKTVYKDVDSSPQGLEICVSVDVFKNKNFVVENFSQPETFSPPDKSSDAASFPSEISQEQFFEKTSPSSMTDSCQTGQTISTNESGQNISTNPTDLSEPVILSETPEQPCVKVEHDSPPEDILQLYKSIDWSFLNEQFWPRDGFTFTFNSTDNKVQYEKLDDNNPDFFEKVSRNTVDSNSKYKNKTPEGFHVDNSNSDKEKKTRGLKFDPGYDYFICPLESDLRKKIYDADFMKRNHCLLRSVVYPELEADTSEQMEIETVPEDENTKERTVANNLQKYYGFMEIFKRKKNGTLFEETGEIND